MKHIPVRYHTSLIKRGRPASTLQVYLVLFFFLMAAASPALAENYGKIIFGIKSTNRNSPIVQVRRADGTNFSLCSGSALSRTEVLTAWHCITQRPSSMHVVVNGKSFGVLRIRPHPDVSTDPVTGAVYNDVAVLHLKTKLTVPRVGILTSKKIARGDMLTIAGYGETENGTFGTLRTGSTAVDDVSKNFIVTVFGRSESNTCSGDSGGPALFTYKDSAGRTRSGIVGITSTGSVENCTYGDQTYFINLQTKSILDFILSQVPSARQS